MTDTTQPPGGLSRQATYGDLVRRVRTLRQAVSDYDMETDKRKRKAEREGGPAARFVVDQMRAPAFHRLRERLRTAEATLASWKPAKKQKADDTPFSQMIKSALAASKQGRTL